MDLAPRTGAPSIRPGARLPRAWRADNVGDPAAITYFEEAIALATEAGQGREVALLHNNLGVMLVSFRGPAEALEIMREGTRFAKGIGNTDMVDALDASTAFTLIDAGRPDEAITLTASIEQRLATVGDVFDLHACRFARTRALTLLGRTEEASDVLDSIEARARASEDADSFAGGLGPPPSRGSARASDRAAIELLRELGSLEHLAFRPLLPQHAPGVRAGGGPARRRSRSRSRWRAAPTRSSPLSQHSRVAANAIITEARGELEAAVEVYADAAERWERFTVVPERAFSLLGQGRCLVDTWTASRGGARPARGATDLRGDRRGARARGDRRAAPAFDRADVVADRLRRHPGRFGRSHRDSPDHRRAAPGLRPDLQRPADGVESVGHARAGRSLARIELGSNPSPSSTTSNASSSPARRQPHLGVGGMRVLRHVLQRLEAAEVDGRLHVRRRSARRRRCSTLTGTAALRACASSAAGKPLSARSGG